VELNPNFAARRGHKRAFSGKDILEVLKPARS
jgi:hypothetical protein